jgi:hypothetical protein
MFMPGALSDCDLFAEACGVAPVLGWPADPSGGLLDQLLAPWLPTSDAQQSCDSNIVPERECFVREPVAAAADASAGNMQDDPDPTTADPAVLLGSTIDAGMRDLGIAPRQGAPGHGTAAATAPSSAPVTSIPGVTRKAARGARAASSDNACAAQSPAPTEHSSKHSSKRKRISADDHRRAQNRKHAADCRARQRAALETAQQEVRDSVAKIEFWKACITELPSGPRILANLDQAAHDQAHTSSSDEACAAQGPAPTDHSSKPGSKRKRLSADDHRREQNRKHTADCRARQRAALETAQQEVRDNAAKVDYFLACCSTLPCGHTILAKFDHFTTSLRS